ncbi:hypothetical protein KQX54_005209 [Cotesia glomerata]|uniref:Uncharacterized protein n=1 Tax=Cotesia glomerata TaxID=32391 RepID=A0AAV7I4R3_COTGL|nr:hypothetical protein KQX54_005209 [Cotesia glomerata]
MFRYKITVWLVSDGQWIKIRANVFELENIEHISSTWRYNNHTDNYVAQPEIGIAWLYEKITSKKEMMMKIGYSHSPRGGAGPPDFYATILMARRSITADVED